jgi:hypothetical protein
MRDATKILVGKIWKWYWKIRCENDIIMDIQKRQNTCMYLYSKTYNSHNISILFYFGTTLYIFRTVYPSIIRSLRLYIQHQVYVIQVLWLLVSRKGMELNPVPASNPSQNLYNIYLMLYYCLLLLMMDGKDVRNM